MVRLILVFLFIVLFLLISLPVQLILWLIGRIKPDIQDQVSLRIVTAGFRGILFLSGTKVTIRGEDKIPTGEGVLFVGNHRSYFDIVLLYANAKALTGFIAKKQTRMIPVFSIWMRFLHCLFLDRNDLQQGLATINKAIELVKRGVNIVIFPEGTRNKTDDILLPFHRGSFRIAQKSGCRIVPVTLIHTDEIYEKHRPFIRRAAVTVIYGDPIDTSTMEPRARKLVDERVREIIEQTYREALP